MALDQTVVEIAAVGGVAIVQAMATDAWLTARSKLATLLGKGDPDRTSSTLAELDASYSIVGTSDVSSEERHYEEVVWGARLATLLSEDPQLANGLRALISAIRDDLGGQISPTVTQHIAVNRDAYVAGRDIRIRELKRGSVESDG